MKNNIYTGAVLLQNLSEISIIKVN